MNESSKHRTPPVPDEPVTVPPSPAADPGATLPSSPTQSFPSSPPATDPIRTDQAALPLPMVPGYELLRELGRGGMGVVYQARHIQLNRLVALKMILAGEYASAADLARFRTEAEAIARLAHTNIVQVYEIGEHDGKPYFSLEYCGGGSLAQKIDGTPWPAKDAARMVQTLARAIHAAHQKSVIHRDLKPANILLGSLVSSPLEKEPSAGGDGLRTKDYGPPKITDFGLAKKLDDLGRTATGAIMGTPSYMAPEQAGGKTKELGPAADIYALGAILYELLTGRPPFRAATPLDTIMQVVSDPPVPPTQLQSKTPKDLETICLKCLAKEPGRRYGSGEELSQDLNRWLNGEPIQARPVGRVARLWFWCRRNPWLAVVSGTAAASLIAMIVVLIIFAAYQTNNAVRLAKNAEDLREEQKQTNAQKVRAEKETIRADERTRAAERLLAESYLDRGLLLCEQGDVERGMVWLAQSLRSAPAGEKSLRRAARANLAHWRQRFREQRLKERPAPKVVFEHGAPVRAVAFSADGKYLLTGGADNTARVWETASGKPAGEALKHRNVIRAVAFSPDGKCLVTGSDDGTAQVWERASGKPLGPALLHKRQVSSVAFSYPDGKYLLTGCYDATARLWATDSGKQVGPPLTHPRLVMSVACSSDGRYLLTGCDDGTARLWETTGRKLVGSFRHGASISCVAFSPDGRYVLIAGDDMKAQIGKRRGASPSARRSNTGECFRAWPLVPTATTS